MNTFTASNGMTVERRANEDVVIDGYTTFMSDGTALALREFFRAEEDERLGRWRWPEQPNWVCYPAGNDVVVFNEEASSFGSCTLSRGGDSWPYYRPAAGAYFDAHPETKPWHDAKPGDVWVFEIEGEEMLVGLAVQRILAVGFNTVTGKSIDVDRLSTITGARRVWPEDAS